MSNTLNRQKILALTTQDEQGYPYYIFIPENISKSPKIFVSIHGITRNAAEHCLRYAQEFDFEDTIIITPLFSKERFKHFQILRADEHGNRPNDALDAILKDVSERLGVQTERFTLSGYSGGGQFAHRYAMLYPDRVAKLILMAPGWYTFPDESVAYPEGVGKNPEFSDLQFYPKGLLPLPIEVIVGERDSRRNKTLNRAPSIDEKQGKNRLERSQNWVKALVDLAIKHDRPPNVKLNIVPNAGHSFKANFDKKQYVKSIQNSTFG